MEEIPVARSEVWEILRTSDGYEPVFKVLRPYMNLHLSREEIIAIEEMLRNLKRGIWDRWRAANSTRDRFLSKYSNYLNIKIKLPRSCLRRPGSSSSDATVQVRRRPVLYKAYKLPPPPPPEEGESDDSVSFRKPSNYCFMCSSTSELGDCPLPLTRRLSKSLVAALQLQSSEGMDYEGNLLGCVVCPPCYEKVIEVNDAVKELEPIQWNLKRMAGQLDELLFNGIQNQMNVQVEIHGVPPTYLTPVELRKKIVNSHRKQIGVGKPKVIEVRTPFNESTTPPLGAVGKTKAEPKVRIPFNMTTRRSTSNQNQPELDPFSPIITSVKTLAPPKGDLGKPKQKFVRWNEPVPGVTNDVIVDSPHSTNEKKIGEGQGQGSKGINTLRAIPSENAKFLSLDDNSQNAIWDHREELAPFEEAEPDFEDPSDLLVIPQFPNPESPIRNEGGGGAPLKTQFDFWRKSKASGVQFQLNLQRKKNVEVELLRCPVSPCGFRCAEGDRLQGHVNGVHHKEPRPFKCNYSGCSKEYTTYSSLTTHHKLSHPLLGKVDRPFKCDQCPSRFPRLNSLRTHKRDVHASLGLTFPCPTCSMMFSTKVKQRYHMRRHGPPGFNCPSTSGCPRAFYCRYELKVHQGSCHPTEFPEYVNLKKKGKEEKATEGKEDEEVDLICEECGDMLYSVQRMKGHMRYKHKNVTETGKICVRIRQCSLPDCGFKTSDVAEMRRHRLSHGVVTPTIPCSHPNCSQLFLNKRTQKEHEKWKHDETNRKQLRCRRCGKEGFPRQAALDRHYEICSRGGRKDFTCGSCHKKFTLLRHLTKHNVANPNCKPKEASARSIYCGICGELCSSNNSLTRHTQLIHNQGSKPFQCTSCPLSFPIKMYLTRHLKESKSCPGSRGYIPPNDQGQNSTTMYKTIPPLFH